MDKNHRRSSRENRLRVFSVGVIALLVAMLEFSTGWKLRNEDNTAREAEARNLLAAQYTGRYNQIGMPNEDDRFRIVYISNSHARTGGEIASHLQRLLDAVSPGRFEVIDFADPGIFAPDMLQRVAFARHYDPDLIIIGAAYIAFSDRMKLSLQAHSVRAFLRPEIRDALPFRFWRDHYDIGLYTTTLVAEHNNLFRYADRLRDRWVGPIASKLRKLDPGKFIHFLEIDHRQSWRFPAGYDQNLFQWHLYSYGRDAHLADLRDAVELTLAIDVPLMAFNAPVHFDKSHYDHDARDYARYQQQLESLFAEAINYFDYQSTFPVALFTYDAIHPSWHGAKLFALHLSLQLARAGMIDATPDDILEEYLEIGVGDGEDYRKTLDKRSGQTLGYRFRRYDLTEAENAWKLIVRVLQQAPGSTAEQNLLRRLSLHARLLTDTQYHLQRRYRSTDEVFERAVDFELVEMRKSADYFLSILGRYQQQRLRDNPLKDVTGLSPVESTVYLHEGKWRFDSLIYDLEDGTTVTELINSDGKVFAQTINNPTTERSYRRVDLFGDGSFVLRQEASESLILPDWVIYPMPRERVGI